jgi:hypothetical protein
MAAGAHRSTDNASADARAVDGHEAWNGLHSARAAKHGGLACGRSVGQGYEVGVTCVAA